MSDDPKIIDEHADRAPTPEEERAAEAAAVEVDVDQVGEHVREAAETGANIRGEGEIEPDLT